MGKNKLYANMATARFKDLIKALSDLEHEMDNNKKNVTS